MLKYPNHIITPIINSKSVFSFNPVVTLIFSLCSGIDEKLVQSTRIYPRSISRYIPWYRASKGGGAITLGSRSWHNITLTENFFSVDNEKYPGTAYANNFDLWMRLCAHEVGHIQHTQKYGLLLWYLIVFAFEYLRYGHNGSRLEKEADLSSTEFSSFNSFVNGNAEQDAIQNLLLSAQDTESKRKKILFWWNQYKEV